MNGGILIVLGLGMFGLWYIPTILAVSKMDVEFSAVHILKVTTGYLLMSFDLDLSNKTKTALTFQGVDLVVYVNGNPVAQVSNPIEQQVNGNSRQGLSLNCQIGWDAFGNTIWQNIITRGTMFRYAIHLEGKAMVNNKSFPFKANFHITEKDFENALAELFA